MPCPHLRCLARAVVKHSVKVLCNLPPGEESSPLICTAPRVPWRHPLEREPSRRSGQKRGSVHRARIYFSKGTEA